MALQSPWGPGFFIFFQREYTEDVKIDRPASLEVQETSRIKEDDEEILLLMRIITGGDPFLR